MKKRAAILICGVLFPGIAVFLGAGYYLLRDWAALTRAFVAFETTAHTNSADLRAVTVANAYQMTYRINCFADGIGVLVGLLLIAIGLHGLCLLPARNPV